MMTIVGAFAASPAAAAAAAASSSPFDPHWARYPRQFSAPYTPIPVAITGDINKLQWQSIPWSEPFDEIRGADDAPSGTRPPASCSTRIKMCWDDDYLYIAALIESDREVLAEFTERNSPIFQKDSDFEVFVDPGGSCHAYKELELNANNVVWNLMLDRPYGDGGSEHSGRVAKPGDAQYYDVNGLKSATKILQGKVNDSTPNSKVVWSVEIALSHKDTLNNHPWASTPTTGSHWRINFSRVEEQGEINWTWQPQIVWDVLEKRFAGKVDMHRPDAWGFVYFDGQVSNGPDAEGANDIGSPKDPTWPARLAAMNIYYAQVVYAEDHAGEYASDMKELEGLVDEVIVDPFDIVIDASNDNKEYVVTVRTDQMSIQVTNERLLTAAQIGQSEVAIK
eukprot:CAMPEP_0197725250 /NCGR_PEP_ID=MMETSP1434-20131217/6857_1 /TAXON_ID=265543 /ORGANISM="Minutocellus polymorphus, Strain CCMP3303" /LENGTH=393 /DNA_ID=CAMNT_0043310703 /DNA_START=35 /DNA_END=1216 /DNA_ORIENTATION=+